MYRRKISLAATVALAGIAVPALAQEGEYEIYDPAIQGSEVIYQPVQMQSPYGETVQTPYAIEGAPGVTWQQAPQQPIYQPGYQPPYQPAVAPNGLPPQPGQRYGYTPEQRVAWLDECRATYYKEDGDGDILGGILGAVTGGLIGNAVGGSEKLGATLIGAGLGGLAGAAIGAAIDVATASDREEDAIDECEAYLAEYEAELRAPAYNPQPQAPAYGYGYGYVPVMMVKVPIARHVHTAECYETVEEWVDDGDTVVVSTKTVRAAPAKTAPVKTVPVKAVKYTK